MHEREPRRPIAACRIAGTSVRRFTDRQAAHERRLREDGRHERRVDRRKRTGIQRAPHLRPRHVEGTASRMSRDALARALDDAGIEGRRRSTSSFVATVTMEMTCPSTVVPRLAAALGAGDTGRRLRSGPPRAPGSSTRTNLADTLIRLRPRYNRIARHRRATTMSVGASTTTDRSVLDPVRRRGRRRRCSRSATTTRQ